MDEKVKLRLFLISLFCLLSLSHKSRYVSYNVAYLGLSAYFEREARYFNHDLRALGGRKLDFNGLISPAFFYFFQSIDNNRQALYPD